MLATVFPPKRHPEDSSEVFTLLAKGLLACGLVCLVWSSYFLAQWARSMSFKETHGTVEFGALRYVQTHVTNVSFDYVVDGKTFPSQNIAIGGRPFGAIPQ